jgi:hypothetical protein
VDQCRASGFSFLNRRLDIGELEGEPDLARNAPTDLDVIDVVSLCTVNDLDRRLFHGESNAPAFRCRPIIYQRQTKNVAVKRDGFFEIPRSRRLHCGLRI